MTVTSTLTDSFVTVRRFLTVEGEEIADMRTGVHTTARTIRPRDVMIEYHRAYDRDTRWHVEVSGPVVRKDGSLSESQTGTASIWSQPGGWPGWVRDLVTKHWPTILPYHPVQDATQ